MTIPSPRANRKARIEIIPLIDIIFFLLATFVLVSLSMVKNKGVPVNLPVASTSGPHVAKDHTVISVTRDGELFFDKEAVTAGQLPARLHDLLANNPDPKVLVRGDEKALFGQTVAVLDELRRVGVTKVAIETKSTPTKPQP